MATDVWCVWCVVCGPDLRGVTIQFVWCGVVWVVRTALPRTALPRDRPFAGPPSAGPPSVGPPKISRFFPFPATIFVLFLSLGYTTARELQTSPKFHEKTPREREKKNENGDGRGKKARNFGPPTLRGRTHRGPTLRGPTFSGFGAPPFGALPLHQAKTALTRTTHPPKGKRTLVRNLRCPNQIGPKSAWPKLA